MMDRKPPFSGNVKEYSEERYTFDNKGEEVLNYKYIWKYNVNNKLSEVHRYSSKNKLTDVNHYCYDELQNILKIVVKTAKGNEKQRLVYEYSDNRLNQVTSIGKNFREIEKFDEYGNLIEEIFYRDANSPPYVTRHKNIYDNNARIIEKWTVLPSGELDSEIKYKYNDRGLLVEEHKTSKLSKNSVSKHTYNERDDLILREFYSDGFGSETHKKEITYNEFNDIAQIKDYRKGYAYRWKDDFGLLSITKYFYIR